MCTADNICNTFACRLQEKERLQKLAAAKRAAAEARKARAAAARAALQPAAGVGAAAAAARPAAAGPPAAPGQPSPRPAAVQVIVFIDGTRQPSVSSGGGCVNAAVIQGAA